jgi:hypothetical protein
MSGAERAALAPFLQGAAGRRSRRRTWLRGDVPTSGYSWRKLEALAVAIEASAQREPYPRLARLMQDIALRDTRSIAARLAHV